MRTETLQLVDERKIRGLLPTASDKALEASGVLARNGHYFIVFDNRHSVGKVGSHLQSSDGNRLLRTTEPVEGYEGITYNANADRYYLLIETRQQTDGTLCAEIVECDARFNVVKQCPLDFKFRCKNKGFEAVAYVRRDHHDHLLALCEGNKCKCGSKGRIPGGGRIQMFTRNNACWSPAGTVKLPSFIPFKDYSAMSIGDNRVAIVSQESSMLWVGWFQKDGWKWQDHCRLFEFPRRADGKIQYGNVEGVAWIGPNRIVAVSDRRKKKKQPKRFSAKDQSIHVFDLPG